MSTFTIEIRVELAEPARVPNGLDGRFLRPALSNTSNFFCVENALWENRDLIRISHAAAPWWLRIRSRLGPMYCTYGGAKIVKIGTLIFQ